jgi:hypothetical protein
MNALEQLKARFAKSGMFPTDDELQRTAVRVSGSLEAYLAYCTENDKDDTAVRVKLDVQHAKWTDAPTITVNGVTHCYEVDRVIKL